MTAERRRQGEPALATILVVDDSTAIRRIIGRILTDGVGVDLDAGHSDTGRSLAEDRLDLVVGERRPYLGRSLGRAGNTRAPRRLKGGDHVHARTQRFGQPHRLGYGLPGGG